MNHYCVLFLRLSNILLYRYTTFCSSICQLIDIWVVPIFWLLWIMLQWTFMHKFLCEYIFNSLEYIFRSGSAGSYGNSMFSLLKNFQLFSKMATSFYISITNVWEFQFLHICQYLLMFVILIMSFLVCEKWYVIVVLIYISQWLMTLCTFPCAYWPVVYLLWRMSIPILWVVRLFIIELYKFFMYPKYKSFWDMWFAKIFFHLMGCLSLSFLIVLHF